MSLPLLIEDGCEDWPAIDKWADLDYLGEEFGNRTLSIIRVDKSTGYNDRGTMALLESMKDTSDVNSRHNNFIAFVNKTRTEKEKYSHYVKDVQIFSQSLKQDFIRPMFIQKVLRPRFTGLDVWPDFDGRKPEMKDRERYVCVVKGKEEFRLVSPVYKQNIYSGVLDELSPRDTPLDFFKGVNHTRYPLFKETKVLTVEATAG